MNEHEAETEEIAVGDKVISVADNGDFARRVARHINDALALDPVAVQTALETEEQFPREALEKIGFSPRPGSRRKTSATLYELAMAGWEGRYRVVLNWCWDDLQSAGVLESAPGSFDLSSGSLEHHAAENLNKVLHHSDESAAALRKLMLAAVHTNLALGASKHVVPSDPDEPNRVSALGVMFGGWDGPTVAYVTDYDPSLAPASKSKERIFSIERASGFSAVNETGFPDPSGVAA